MIIAWPFGLVGGMVALLTTNTLQSGPLVIDTLFDTKFGPNQRETIDLESLKSIPTKAEFTQLFLRCSVPTTKEYTGTYEGYLLDLGICAPISNFISNRLFGPGRWLGKEFNADDVGVNLFGVNNNRIVQRSKQFSCYLDDSSLDGKPTLALHYSPFNRFHPVAWGMRDELRKVDRFGNVLIGCGGLAISGGVRNYAPFVLIRTEKSQT